MDIISKIIHEKKLDRRAIAETLFPKASHPLQALNRIETGISELSAEQYRTLAKLTGIPLGFLVSQDWLIQSDTPNEVNFLRGDIIGVLNTQTWLTVVHEYHAGVYKPIFEVQGENVPLSVYLKDLTDMVISNNVKHLKS